VVRIPLVVDRSTKDNTDETVESDDRAVVGRAQVDERLAARRRFAAQTDGRNSMATAFPSADETVVFSPAGPRPRASLLATLSLVFGVAAVLTVLTGALAGPGVALGLLAVILGIGGMSATGRRHVAGKSDAMLGMALALGAIVLGTLTLTGTLPWLTPDTNQVSDVRAWLESHAPWLFPNNG
jgi:hypothetical protein